jgi:hypothetical protein
MMRRITIICLICLVLFSLSLSAAAGEAVELDTIGPDLATGPGVKAIDYFPAPSGKAQALQLPSAPSPLAETFTLHSCPSASKVIYLDFDGHYGLEEPGIYYAPFNFEGSADTFSEAELTTIQLAWHSVAEDFLAFDVDVTTENPGVEALRNTGGNDIHWGIRCVVSASNWDYSWAYIGSFNWDTDYESQIYPGDNSWIWIGDSVSHEVGHSMWLGHDGGGGDGEYYGGHGSGATTWSPIMGWTAAIGVSQWSIGEYEGANNQEDDLLIISTQNGFGYRSDDHGSTPASATAISLASGPLQIVAEGNIERTEDLDYFAFSLQGDGDVEFLIEPDQLNANLDILAQIHDADGAVLYSSNPADSLHAAFDLFLNAGDYYLSIDGTGFGTPPVSGYSDYGSLGYFTIKAWGDSQTAIVSGDEFGATNLCFIRRPSTPFNSSNTFSFSLKESQHAQAQVFDVSGRLVETLHEGQLAAGVHNFTWDINAGNSSIAGLYFLRVQAGEERITSKMLFIP